MTVANAITMIRILLVPIFIYYFAVGDRGAAFVVFCVAGGSDLIDGTVARVLKQRSSWGAILDPMADKLLLESAFICLVVAGVLPLWFLILAFSRDLMITFGIIFFKVKRIDFPHRAIWTSKAATFVQMATIVSGLIWWWKPGAAVFGVRLDAVILACMIAAAALIAASGVLYVRMGLNCMAKARGSA
jgi:cardiolipin synthase